MVGRLEVFPSRGADKQVEEQVLSMWQERWELSPKGRETYKFFPDVKRRMSYTWVTPKYYVSQFLTGHGDFRAKLAGFFEHTDRFEGEKGLCECGGEDSSTHVLIECPLFAAQRESLSNGVNLGAPGMFERLVSTEEFYQLLTEYSKTVLEIRKGQRQVVESFNE